MKQKIFESLKTKYPNLGFSKEVLEGVATQLSTFITEESQIANAVAGAEPTLKAFQSFADARVGTIRTENEKYKSELQTLKAKLAEIESKKKPEEPTEDIPSWAKAIVDEVKNVKTTVSNFQQENISKTLKEQFIDKMKKQGVDHTFIETALIGRNFNSLEEVENLASVVTENFEKHKQDLADKGFSYTKPPENGGSPEKEEEEAIANVIKQGTKEIIEQSKN